MLGSGDSDPTTGPRASPCHSCVGGLVTIKGPGLSSPEQHSKGIWGNQTPLWGRGAESPRAEWGRQPGSEKKRRASTQVQDSGRSTDWASVPGLRRVPSPGARPHPWLPLSSSPGSRGWSAALRWGWWEAQCWDQSCRETGRGRGETEQNINAGLTRGRAVLGWTRASTWKPDGKEPRTKGKWDREEPEVSAGCRGRGSCPAGIHGAARGGEPASGAAARGAGAGPLLPGP